MGGGLQGGGSWHGRAALSHVRIVLFDTSMTLLNGTQYFRVAFECHMQGQQCVTTIAVKADPTTPLDPVPDAPDFATDMDNWLGALYANMVTIDGALDNISVTELRAGELPGGQQYVKSVNRAGARDNSGDQLPEAMVSWHPAHTGVASRSARGGWYGLPATRRLNLDSSGVFDLGTTYGTSAAAFSAALLDGDDFGPVGLSGHYSYVIWSRTLSKRGVSPHAFDVVSIGAPTTPHWLRSRFD